MTVVHGAHQEDGASLYAVACESDPCAANVLVDAWNGDPLHVPETALLTLMSTKSLSA
jgi:hypothetical protein